ncbi:cilia- and flagella-associated protein 300 [Myripristis murdjan]|uniref:cilia- and flagella-associated protein 300 n=1 Tax=Myripristis murdjan TaxID=586833 RepID=UPI0011761747|nr:cilia- and flagella-associated protein 300 [Myripristis murdjan]
MAGEKHAFEPSFSFSPLPSKKFSFLHDKATLGLFMKWSMLGRISVQAYSFDQSFYPYNSQDFTLSFFRDPNVAAMLRKMEAWGAWVPLGIPVVSVDVEVVPCTKVSMELFDPIYSCGIVRPCGRIVGCLHDVYPDYDELRQMLQEEDSEHYYVVGREERGEFLFRLFKHLCLGGELCQHEDAIDPYINTTKQIYKDLISVQKDPEIKEISVISTVLKVCAYDEHGRCYPGRQDEEQTFAYMIIDPFKRHVALLYHCYGVGDVSL